MRRLWILPAALFIAAGCTDKGHAKDSKNNPHIVFETTEGDIEIELFKDKAPITTKNILKYVEDGFYDGIIFHRVIPGFVIQGGGYDEKMKKKSVRDPIKNEATNGLKNKRGTLSMARTGVVDSATSQFFINLSDNARLDHRDESQRGYGYAVFGKVVDGLDVVDKIAKTPTCPKAGASKCGSLPPGMKDVPAEPIVVKDARRK